MLTARIAKPTTGRILRVFCRLVPNLRCILELCREPFLRVPGVVDGQRQRLWFESEQYVITTVYFRYSFHFQAIWPCESAEASMRTQITASDAANKSALVSIDIAE